jgi:hypothetical protein
MSDCELHEKISELQVSSDPPKRGRGRPKKEKPPKVKREPLTEEERKERISKCKLEYNKRRRKFGESVVSLLNSCMLAPVSEEASRELRLRAERQDIQLPEELYTMWKK